MLIYNLTNLIDCQSSWRISKYDQAPVEWFMLVIVCRAFSIERPTIACRLSECVPDVRLFGTKLFTRSQVFQ